MNNQLDQSAVLTSSWLGKGSSNAKRQAAAAWWYRCTCAAQLTICTDCGASARLRPLRLFVCESSLLVTYLKHTDASLQMVLRFGTLQCFLFLPIQQRQELHAVLIQRCKHSRLHHEMLFGNSTVKRCIYDASDTRQVCVTYQSFEPEAAESPSLSLPGYKSEFCCHLKSWRKRVE